MAGYELREYLLLKFGHQCAYRRDESPCDEYFEVEHIIVPKGKKQGVYVGKVAVRSSGNFNIVTAQGAIQGVSYHHCRSLHRADGYSITG